MGLPMAWWHVGHCAIPGWASHGHRSTRGQASAAGRGAPVPTSSSVVRQGPVGVIFIPMSSQAIRAGRALDVASQADSRQADYYRWMLRTRQECLDHQLARADSKLATAVSRHDSQSAQRLLMLLHELKAEWHEVHRLAIALDYRFPPSVVRVTPLQSIPPPGNSRRLR